jgi:HlyD family secretion protein
MASAQAALQLARANEARMKSLFQQEYVSRQELDQAVQAREAAEAQAGWRARRTTATAPTSATR